MRPEEPRLRSRLEVETEFGIMLGDTRIRLLEAIDSLGAISRAAKQIPMSYKAAWDAIDTMNNLAAQPLVIRAAGGRQGGGTLLTAYGKRMVAMYRALEVEYQLALDRLTAGLRQGEAHDLLEFRQLLRHMKLQTSARNQFSGEVIALKAGPIDVEVRMRLDDQNELVAIITRESAEHLGLMIGSSILALIKSSSVVLSTESDLKTSARNQLWGKVTRLHEGEVNAEVILTLPSGKTLCSVISKDSVQRLELALELSVCGMFEASSVILCRQD